MVYWSASMGGATDEERRRLNRLHIIFVMQAIEESGVLTYLDEESRRVVHRQDEKGFFKLGFFTFDELLKATQLSRGVLANHLGFLEREGYLFSKNGVYRLNPEFRNDFKRISSKVVAWLGARALSKSRKALHRFLRPELGKEGYQWYKEEIERFAVEEKRLRGIEL
jgi:hypothetical protein